MESTQLNGFLVSLPADPHGQPRGWPQPEIVDESAVWFHGYLADPGRLRGELGLDPSASSGRIVATGLRRWRDGAAERITGEYAAVVVSESTTTLLSDRMALRPLYYAALPDMTVVSTDLGALARETEAWRDVDEDYLADLFSTGMHLGPRTPYRDIRRLQIGEYATCDRGRVRVHRGWQPSTEPIDGTFDDHRTALRSTVKDAVAHALSSGGTAAAELSGGLDTSTVLAVAAELRPMHALSFVHPQHPGSDESSWARAALEATTATWHPIDASENGTFTAGPELGVFLPAPSRRILNWAPTVAEEELTTRVGISVLLTGEGGDAVFFAGLLPWYLADLLRTGRFVQLRREARRWGAEAELSRSAAFWIRRAAIDGLRCWRSGQTLALEPSRTVTTSAPWLDRAYIDSHDLEDRGRSTTSLRADSVHGQAVLENIVRGAEFARSRHVFASTGADVRHPLLSPAVIDLALGTPWDIATDPRIDRAVQRYAFDGLVSDKVLRRRSKPRADEAVLQGFERSSQWRDYLGTDPQIVGRGYVDAEQWQTVLGAVGRVGGLPQLYTAIQIEVWLRHLRYVGPPQILTVDDGRTSS